MVLNERRGDCGFYSTRILSRISIADCEAIERLIDSNHELIFTRLEDPIAFVLWSVFLHPLGSGCMAKSKTRVND